MNKNISTHTPLARRDILNPDSMSSSSISTHTPLARRDKGLLLADPRCDNFYSHASCEAWLKLLCPWLNMISFLLTRLLRGVTYHWPLSDTEYLISTHTPLARRDTIVKLIIVPINISTHTPLARRDCYILYMSANHATMSEADYDFFKSIVTIIAYFPWKRKHNSGEPRALSPSS